MPEVDELQKGKWIIGDVHGCWKTLWNLLIKIRGRTNEDLLFGPKVAERLVFVGDLIDRGPSSKSVIDFVRRYNVPCVRGNHEDMWLNKYNQYESGIWVRNGGNTTLVSYSHFGL